MQNEITLNLDAIGEILASAVNFSDPNLDEDLEILVEQALISGAAIVGKEDACCLVAVLVSDLRRHMRTKSMVFSMLEQPAPLER